ncbi:MAG: spore maturation protein [Deltaproteobacteria bacterium RBG_16_49_23]|nr:MAG: spore maturation protein [Deltaproteobacteria bacterium RBG_16_49_23]
MKTVSLISQLIIPFFILFTILYGCARRVRVYDCFISGAKGGLGVVIRIFPYLLAIFVAVKAFQASGAFEFAQELLRGVLEAFHVPIDVVSISLIKPLSGSASLGVFTNIVKTNGPDSLAGRISAVIMGSAETTFYVLAVYLGAVGMKRTRYLVPVCILADLFGIIIAISIVKFFFH